MRTERELETTVALANLALDWSRGFDRAGVARGLVAMAMVVAGDDPIARTALARDLLAAARRLDPDLLGATWQ